MRKSSAIFKSKNNFLPSELPIADRTWWDTVWWSSSSWDRTEDLELQAWRRPRRGKDHLTHLNTDSAESSETHTGKKTAYLQNKEMGGEKNVFVRTSNCRNQIWVPSEGIQVTRNKQEQDVPSRPPALTALVLSRALQAWFLRWPKQEPHGCCEKSFSADTDFSQSFTRDRQ